jgi:uncharacterized ParB-like nuclease family protein
MPIHETLASVTESPKAAVAQLTTPDMRQRYEELTAFESETFDLAATQQALEEKYDTAVASRKRDIDAMEDLPPTDPKVEATLASYGTYLAGLEKQQKHARARDGFLARQKNLWQRDGTMLFHRQDPNVGVLASDMENYRADQRTPSFLIDEALRPYFSDNPPKLVVDAREQPLNLPLASVVSAAGLESWETGRGKIGLKDTGGARNRRSADVIQEYAARPTDFPPVEGANVLLTNDGQMLVEVTSGAHRTAAAKMRGDETLACSEVAIYCEPPANLGEQITA